MELYPLIDKRCGKVAFYSEVKPRQFSAPLPPVSNIYYPDGTHPVAGNLVTCGSCGQPPTGLTVGEKVIVEW